MANTKIPSELVAINAISGTLIADNAITSVHIAENNITATQIAINAVTALQMADGTITSAKIADGTIVTADIADGQITTGKIADSSVTTAKIAAGTILGGDIANNAILTQHIDDNQITADQIADNAVGLGQLASLSRGSLIYGNSAGNPAYLAAGTSGHVLTSDGTDISWTADTDLFLATTGGTITGALTGTSAAFNSGTTNVVASFTSTDGTGAIQLADNAGNVELSAVGNDFHIQNAGAAAKMVVLNSGKVGIGTTTIPHGGIGRAKFAINGTDSDAQGPHLQYTTDTDDYPVFQQLNWSHDNISLNFDSYFDGVWRSSDAGSNFQIYKNVDLFSIKYDSGINPGDGVSWNDGFVIDTAGKVGIGTASPSAKLSFGNYIPTNGQTLHIYQNGNSVSGLGVVSGVYRNFTSSDASLSFGHVSTSDGSTYSERMHIDSSGIVHIGTGTAINDTNVKLQLNAPSGGEASLGINDNGAYALLLQYTSGTGARIRNIKSTPMLFETNGSERMRINSAGNVGIGEDDPQTKLHVFGTDPVIRVSDDSTSGFATLELRQQNTATEGVELRYDSSTGHTHLNNVYSGGDLKFATATGGFGTTTTNTRLAIKADGVIEVGKSNVGSDRIKFMGTTNVGAPNTSNHATGTRLSLYDSSSTAWYAIGIESETMWFHSDGNYNFYQDNARKVQFDGSAPMPVVRAGPSASNAMRLGSVTAVFPYSGLSLIVAASGVALTVHSSTNTTTSWQNLSSNLADYLVGTATFNTINTSQQANIIVYLNVATKVYLMRDSGWNSVDLTGWTRISDDNVYSTGSSRVYVRYLHAGTHSLDNNSALYFFEAPIGP